jgi:hypothetical protein
MSNDHFSHKQHRRFILVSGFVIDEVVHRAVLAQLTRVRRERIQSCILTQGCTEHTTNMYFNQPYPNITRGSKHRLPAGARGRCSLNTTQRTQSDQTQRTTRGSSGEARTWSSRTEARWPAPTPLARGQRASTEVSSIWIFIGSPQVASAKLQTQKATVHGPDGDDAPVVEFRASEGFSSVPACLRVHPDGGTSARKSALSAEAVRAAVRVSSVLQH